MDVIEAVDALQHDIREGTAANAVVKAAEALVDEWAEAGVGLRSVETRALAAAVDAYREAVTR